MRKQPTATLKELMWISLRVGCSLREHPTYQRYRRVGSAPSISLLLPPPVPRLGEQALHRQLHILGNLRQKAALVAGDGVSGHTEFLGELLLSETKEEPLTTKLPTGQAAVRLPKGAWAVNALVAAIRPRPMAYESMLAKVGRRG